MKQHLDIINSLHIACNIKASSYILYIIIPQGSYYSTSSEITDKMESLVVVTSTELPQRGPIRCVTIMPHFSLASFGTPLKIIRVHHYLCFPGGQHFRETFSASSHITAIGIVVLTISLATIRAFDLCRNTKQKA